MYKMKDFKPMIGFEKLYLVNEKGRVKALDRTVTYMGIPRVLKQQTPEQKQIGNNVYVFIRDENWKNRKINLTKMIANLFGRQKPIIKNAPYKYTPVIEKVQKVLVGKGGYAVEQYDGKVLVAEFKTMAKAAQAVNGDYRYISDCCYGIRKFAYGYKWNFKTIKQ